MTNSCSLVLLELGLAAFNENNDVIASKKFVNPVLSFNSIRSGRTSAELEELVKSISDFDYVLVNDSNLNDLLNVSGVKSHMMTQEQQDEVQEKKQALLITHGFANDERDAIQQLRNFAIELSSSKVKEESQKLDLHAAQAVNSLDEIDQILNTMGTRLREWYGLHFPELDHLISSIISYAIIVKRAGWRQNISKEILGDADIEDRKADLIISTSRRSKGGDLTAENLEILQSIAEQVIVQSTLRRTLAEHLEKLMVTVAPNVTELLTASLGARAIAKVGSLMKLAVLPASTIQVLGAEKALFRSLRTGANPPKHGILFQHSLVHSAPRWQRGKIARALASKVAIAARIDLYRHGVKDPSIIARLKRRIAEIQERYKVPVMAKKMNGNYKPVRQRFKTSRMRRQGGRRITKKRKGFSNRRI